MANYCVIRTDLMSGTAQPADLVSAIVYDANGTTPIEVENGSIIELGDYIDGEREVYAAKLATAGSNLAKCVVVATPEVFYDERKKNLDEFVNEAGTIVRGYILRSRNIFSITAPGFVSGTAPTTKGAGVGLGAGGKIDASGSDLGTVADIETAGRYTYYAIRLA